MTTDPTPTAELVRERAAFISGDTTCAAWHYPGSGDGCVVMAGGLAVTKEPATDRLARSFQAAGLSVLAFDFRGIGESGGKPRLVVRVNEQLADWEAAIGCARGLPGVDPAKVAIWGFSLSGGEVLAVAAGNPDLAAVIAQCPLADGRAAMPNALRHTTPGALVRLMGRGVLDALGGFAGREPLLIPLAGPPGTVALLSTPDSLQGAGALDPEGRYRDWKQLVAARSALRVGSFRPVRAASRIGCPLLVVVCDDDLVAPPAAAIRAAELAPRGELVRLPGGHYAPFLDQYERTVEAELSFLNRQLG